MERFYVEWNAGAGWMTNAAHTFWTEAAAKACRDMRTRCDKLGKWPMRLVLRDPATGVQTVVAG